MKEYLIHTECYWYVKCKTGKLLINHCKQHKCKEEKLLGGYTSTHCSGCISAEGLQVIIFPTVIFWAILYTSQIVSVNMIYVSKGKNV